MDGIQLHFTAGTSLSVLLLILLQSSTKAQLLCEARSSVQIAENNNVGDVVETITVEDGVSLDFKPPPSNPDNPFSINGNQLVATRALDYETNRSHVAEITCTQESTSLKSNIIIVVIVLNVNDNPPVFAQNLYNVNVNEMSPSNTSVGLFPATDLDQNVLYYTLTSESGHFALQSPTSPNILVKNLLDYEKVKTVPLLLSVQDTPLAPADERVSFTATATILVTVVDVDNRPPWFQPCARHEVAGAVVCQNAGYTTQVTLNQEETEVLQLRPAQLHAIDGDDGINEEITYSFLSGNEDGLFGINPTTGNISLLRAADVLGTISLTVLAAQRRNSYQFATTSIAVSVLVKSLHRPQFEKARYEGVVSAVGAAATDTTGELLRIVALDKDYAATGGLNPHISYHVNGNEGFSIIDGYLFMTKELPEGPFSLNVVAEDTSNGESETAQLSVEVTSGDTTTISPSTSTSITSMTSLTESSTISSTTPASVPTSPESSSTTTGSIPTSNPSSTSQSVPTTPESSSTTTGSFPTSNPSSTSQSVPTTPESSATTTSSDSTTKPSITRTTADITNSPTDPSSTSAGGSSTSISARPLPGPTAADMAALGATLGVLLLICLVVIGVLVHQLRKGKSDWRKIFETNTFRSALIPGSGGNKEGIQYTNEAFQNDDDGASIGSGGAGSASVKAADEPLKAVGDLPLKETIARSSAPLLNLLGDTSSQTSLDRADNEKEVKPILTKERRTEDGYKAVWFKEDIDPDAKEEVVIIPDSREEDSEEESQEPSRGREEEEEEEEEEGEGNSRKPKVGFTDADVDSGLGVKIEQPAEDSDSDEVLTVDL